MGATSTPTCLHCGNAIDRPDKPFCSKCGQYWALPAHINAKRSPLPIQLPTFTYQNETSISHLEPETSVSTWSQVKDDLLRVSMHMQQQQGIFSADEPRVIKSSLAQFNKPLSSSPLTSEELREKLHMLQEKMQLRSDVQEKVGPLHTALETQSASSFRPAPIVLRAALTQDELLLKLRGLRAQASEDQTSMYPGTKDSGLAEIAPVWHYQLERIHKSIDFLASTQGEPEREREIRQQLSEALRQLDVTRPYHVTLVDYVENGTSILLAALLGEDIFLRQFCAQKSVLRIVVRNSEQKEQEKMYVYFQDESQPSKAFFRKEWLEVWTDPDYLPQNASQQTIHAIEFALHTSLLPPGSSIVLLPQGEHFKAQFEAEITETDVLVLVVDGTRPNYASVRHLVEQLRPYLLQERSPDHSARMFFLAATYQNRTDTTEDLEITTSNLRSLLPFLPAHYEHHHHHGAGKNYFFYPLWVMDAFFATSGMQQRSFAPDLQVESQYYVERLQTSYEKIRGLFPTLPPTCEATTFHEISFEQHEAMLRMSNLPELSQDLRDFLRDVRQRIQLSYARNAIQRALQLLEDFAWEQLRPHYAVPTHSLETLEEVLSVREQRRKVERRHYITHRITAIKNAWEEALVHFEMTTLSSEKAPSSFHERLEQAHTQAVNALIERILQGNFDSCLEHNGSQSAPTWSIDHLGHEVHLRKLLGKMRSALHVALEAELEQAAQELSQTFLQTLQKHEKNDGELIIYDAPLQNFAAALSDVQKQYRALKIKISQKALEACRTITRSELLNEQRRLHKQTPAIRELLNFVNADEEQQEKFQSQAHRYLEDLLHTLHQDLLSHTERPIIDYFRYELESLDQHEVYRRVSQPPTSSEPGDFTVLLEDLEDLMVEQLRTSEEFRQQLNILLYPVQDTVTTWHTLIKDIRKIKHTPIATRIP